jgi:hypothetical protein
MRNSVNTEAFSQYSAEQLLDAYNRLKTDRPTGYLTAQKGVLKSFGENSVFGNQEKYFCVIKANEAMESFRINSPVVG